MIRFVDLTPYYWPDEGDESDPNIPVCSFIDTITKKYLVNVDGDVIFWSLEEVAGCDHAARCLWLLPDDFFAPLRT